ncbi:MAG: hypothetical protein M1275_03385 [Patescibacteria group bacterium]|nr:hypothetical protein [Patescibacteria group bacterium]
MRRYVLFGVILAAILIGVVVYFFFLDSSNTVVTPGGNAANTGLAGESGPKLLSVTQTPVLSAVLSLDQTSIWYFGRDGQLYQNALGGGGEQKFNLTGTNPAIQKVYWPSVGNNFIVWTKAPEGIGSYLSYVAAQQAFVTLPSNIQEVAWMPNGQQILYVWRRGDGDWELKLGNVTAENYRTVANLDGAYALSVAGNGKFALLKKAVSEGGTNKILMVDMNSGKLSELLDRGQNVDVALSPDSNKLLFTRVSSDTKLSELWLYNFENQSFENLNLPTALSKVVWENSSDGFYFGKPRSVSANDSTISSVTADDLYLYRLSDKSKTRIDLGGEDKTFDIRDPIIDSGNSMLFFRDGKDNSLYRVNLK